MKTVLKNQALWKVETNISLFSSLLLFSFSCPIILFFSFIASKGRFWGLLQLLNVAILVKCLWHSLHKFAHSYDAIFLFISQAMTFMGFSLTCGFFCAIIIFWNAEELSDAGTKTIRIITDRNNENYRAVNVPLSYDSKYKEEHALIGAIFAFTVVELILSMWSASLCLINDRQVLLTNVSYKSKC